MVRFTFLSVPVIIRFSFFITAIIIGATYLAHPLYFCIRLAALFFSVLLHEFGHALGFGLFGHKAAIELYGFGGVTSAKSTVRPWQDILISLAGPLAGFLLGGGVLLLRPIYPDQEHFNVLVSDLILFNIGWGLFNLLPILPLDGGRIMSAGLTYLLGNKANLATHIVSSFFAVAALGLAMYMRSLWVALLAAFFLLSNFQALLQFWRRRLDFGLADRLHQCRDGIAAGQIASALTMAQAIFQEARSVPVKLEALLIAAWARFLSKDAQGALADLERMAQLSNKGQKADTVERLRQGDPFLAGCVLRSLGRLREAADLLTIAMFNAASGDVATVLTATLIELGDTKSLADLIASPYASMLDDEALAHIEASLYHAGDYRQGLALSQKRFKRNGDPTAAYNAACAAIKLGERHDAIIWLNRALDAGFKESELLASDPDLQPLHGDPEFSALLKRAP
jgi:stage IV sporulation protein FB